ncbi:outer membrane lipoprotein chaperone LolA [Sodalis sp. CWE]|uniref:outer membrane lipoprotein chaperone LolA n=1 Tax=Sodalis sp. CWE TaxID=2803816 RepID=UPI001C7CD63C|nr:outer membrane lipoprotein chaperone LolA [Sodalis sp. CWE]MBX4181142.1 outer membrane lipoprotein chaperone LolA [Sodalis sp. CWE]
MKKQLKIIFSFIFVFISFLSKTLAYTNDAKIFQSRLNQIHSFRAEFTQKIIDTEGNCLQKSVGVLTIKRPNLFIWHTTIPDETILISDGKTLWFYNPFIEQVTANWLEDVSVHVPYLLIIGDTTNLYQYNIKKKDDNFYLIPKSNRIDLKKIKITISIRGIITNFSLIEKNGQQNIIEIINQKNSQIKDTEFHFIIPKGVILDDQR